MTFTIAQATPTVTVSDAGGTYSGSTFPATGAVNGGGNLESVTPTLTYYAGSAATGSALSGAPSVAGTYTVVANFAGSTDFKSATSTPATFTIAQATPAVTVSDAGGTYTGSSFPASGAVNGSGSLESVTPTLIYYAGSTATGTALSGTPSVAGTYTVVANFAGSTDFKSATSTPATFTISQATPTVTVSDAGGTYSGSAFPASGAVNGGGSLESVTPTLTYYAGSTATGTALSGAPSVAGTYTVVANFAGSTDFKSATSTPATFTISQATPTVTVSDAGGIYTGSAFPAAGAVNGGGSLESITPTLTYYAGSAATGTALSGVPSVAGTYTVVANFSGSTDFKSATSTPATFTITQATPTVTVSDAGGIYTGSAFPATDAVNGNNSLESVTPTLTYYAGSTATGTALSGVPSVAGTYTVVANFAGSTDFKSATSTPATFTITQAAPTVTVSDAGGIYTGSAFPATDAVNGNNSLESVTPTLTYYAGSTATGTALWVPPVWLGRTR